MGRLKLNWFNLTQLEGQDLCLTIPLCDAYRDPIDRAFPDVIHIGWRPGSKGTCYTYIKEITAEERARLNDFLELLNNTLYLTLTEHLAPYFQKELDEAYALDFNFQSNVFPLAYTEVGTFEHLAKEKQNIAAMDELATKLCEVIQRHPTFLRVIAPMPPRPSKTFHLPTELVNRIGRMLNRPVALLLSKSEHPKLRDLPMHQKVETLSGVLGLEESVESKTVLVIDDLYQSGTSAWSLASFLKARGAREVYALTCVKSWSDTDNV